MEQTQILSFEGQNINVKQICENHFAEPLLSRLAFSDRVYLKLYMLAALRRVIEKRREGKRLRDEKTEKSFRFW